MTFATITSVAGAEKITCPAGQTIECAFTITSLSPEPIRIGLQPLVEEPTKKEWLEVVGAKEIELAESGSENVAVRLGVPGDAEPGKYPFRLRAYATDDPEQSAESPAIAADVPVPAKAAQPAVEKPKGGFPWWIVAVVAAVLVLTGGGVAAWFAFSGSEVPEVKGMTLEEAVDRLEEEGFAVGTVSNRITGTANAGVVLEQSPNAGTEADKDTAVDLSVEGESVAVPELVGMSVNEAEDAVKAAGLKTGTITTEQGQGQKAGTVLHQSPAGGALMPADTVVDLTVVEEAQPVVGPKTVSVPKVIGQTREQASRTLVAKGLRVGEVNQHHTGASPGVVLTQSPDHGTRAKRGSSVDLTVEAALVVVPHVKGMKGSEARDVLQKAGFQIGKIRLTRAPGSAAGTVLLQSPTAGRRKRPGTPVNLTVVGKFSSVPPRSLVTVPDVIGLPLTTARSTLSRQGLRVRTKVTKQITGGTPPVVHTQHPPTRAKVAKGTEVTLYLVNGKVVPLRPTVKGTLRAGQVQLVVQRNVSKLASCYYAGLRKDPRSAGKMGFTWTIERGGKTSGVRRSSGTFSNSKLASCVASAIGRMRFPAPPPSPGLFARVKPVKVTEEFSFRTSGPVPVFVPVAQKRSK